MIQCTQNKFSGCIFDKLSCCDPGLSYYNPGFREMTSYRGITYVIFSLHIIVLFASFQKG